jgi:hypothetical protein
MISSFYSKIYSGQFGIWVVELWRVCWLCFFTVPRPSLVLVWAPDHIVLLKFLWTSIGSWALEYRVDGIYRMKFTGSVEWDSNNSNLPIYMEFLDEIWIYPIYRSCPRFLSHRQLSRQSPVAAIVAPCLAVPGLGSDLSHVWHSLRMWLKAWGGHAMILFLLGICSDNIYICTYGPGVKMLLRFFLCSVWA